MPGLPPLNEEDMEVFNSALDELLQKSEAIAALAIDKGGPIISQRGMVDKFDMTTIAALAAGAFCATQAIAESLGETHFASIYQQGRSLSVLFCNIDENALLVILFKAEQSAGAVKYYAVETVPQISDQLQRAQERSPGQSVDLVAANVLNAATFFSKNPPN
jgi:predicted regulator of Ras-like GTPase activity (Roadblock/LC7/MglB family)